MDAGTVQAAGRDRLAAERESVVWRICLNNRLVRVRMTFLVAIVVVLGGCAGFPESWGLGGAASKNSTGPFSDQELIASLRELNVDAQGEARGIVVRCPELSFGSETTRLSPKARKTLRQIALLLNDPRASDRAIAVEGHTDSTGAQSYNLELSRKRAETVSRELIFNMVQRQRIRIDGRGEQSPVAPNVLADGRDNPEGRGKNRRVEIIIASQQAETR
jgi:outer membrane protein OmpA-like peptidoglycan-associated protein